MRRAVLTLSLLVIVAAAAWTLWRWNDRTGSAPDPWRAVPAQAAVIIEVPDAWVAWDRFTHTDPLWRDLATRTGAHTLAGWMTHLQAAQEKDGALREALARQTILIAVMRNGSQGAGWVAVGGVRGELPETVVGDLFGMAANDRVKLASGQVMEVRPVPSLPVCFFAWRQGLWILGSSAALVDEALMQQDAGTPITADPLLARARETLGESSQAHLLLHTTRITGLLLDAWEAERLERLDLPEGWLALDANLGSGEWLLSGLLVPARQHAVLTSIAEQGSGAWNIGRVLPESVVQWEVRHVEDAMKQLAMTPTPADANTAMEILPEWAYGPIGTALACDSIGRPGRRWLVIGAGDPEGARMELERPCALASCDTVVHRGTRITRLQEMHPYELLMGRQAVLPQQAWWAVLGDQLVMSDDVAAVRASIDTWNDGGSLAEDERANACFQRMSDDAALTWWCDPVRGGTLFREGLKAGTDTAFAAWLPVLGLSSGLSLQLSPAAHGMTHVSVLLLHAPSGSSVAVNAPHGALWSCTMDAPIRRVPDVVINHVNNTRELLVQDTLHRIHLISAAGQRLWSRALDGPIMGAVHQVDRFQNGKLQLLFNTATACHLVDRNGKDVGGFPFALRANACAPLAVFDYEGTREYRVLLPLIDGSTINITAEGKVTDGWSMPKLEAPAIAAVRHLRIRNRDHLLLIDANGAIRLFDRKGNERERVKAVLADVDAVHDLIVGPDLMAVRVLWTDKDGALHETTLDGNTRTLPIDPTERLLVGSHAATGLLLRGDSIVLREANGSEITLSLGTRPDPPALACKLWNGAPGFALSSANAEQAWIVDGTGRMLVECPLQGVLPPVVADLDRDGTLEAITLTKDRRLLANRITAP